MWIVVDFVNDNAVEAVPETWYDKKNQTCAWPLTSKNLKKYIAKQDYPDKNNYKWFPARVLGRKYATIEEARSKSKIAQIQSELSANDEDLQNKSKRIGSPPLLKPSKIRKIENKTNYNLKTKINYNNDTPESDIDNSDDDPDYSQPMIIDGKKRKTDNQSKRVFDKIDNNDSDIEDGHDSDKDPDYHKPISVNDPSISQAMTKDPDYHQPISVNVSQAMTNHNNKYVMNSPIGKFSIEETNLSIMSSMPPKPLIESITLPSPQRSNTTPSSNPKKRVLFSTVGSKGSNNRSSKYNTDVYGMPNAVPSVSHAMTNRNNKYVMNSPIGKILIEETSPSIMSSMPPKQPFIEYINLPSPVSHRSNTTPLSQRSNTIPLSRRSNTTPLTCPIKRVLFPTVETQGSNRSSKYNTEYDCGMTDTAFKNFVVSSLTKVKHEISAIHSTVNSSYMVLEGFINNFGQSRATEIAMQYESGCSLDDFFPITNEEDLQLLNNKIKSDKQFRLNMVSKLSLLVGTKDVGDSVRRLMGRMFIDDVLTEYSLLGKKKKKNFSELPVYQLLIDALRIHQKYKDKINKDFNDPLANWLNHSKFRLLNKAVEKNNKL